jgi:hypothetical protein
MIMLVVKDIRLKAVFKKRVVVIATNEDKHVINRGNSMVATGKASANNPRLWLAALAASVATLALTRITRLIEENKYLLIAVSRMY